MSGELEFKVIGSIGEINLTENDINSAKIESFNVTDSEYVSCISFLKSFRITCFKFVVCSDKINEKKKMENSTAGLPFINVSLCRVLNVPFSVSDFSLTNESFWILGQEYNADIKPYIQDALKLPDLNEDIVLKDNSMDIDNDDEFNFQEFEIDLKLPSIQNCSSPYEKFYLRCSFIPNSVIVCSKDGKAKLWYFVLTISRFEPSLRTELSESFSLPTMPLTYVEKCYLCPEVEMEKHSKPVITFIYEDSSTYGELQKSPKDICHKFLSINPLSTSNCIGLMGHPEGRVLFFLCSWTPSKQFFETNTQLELLYDIKQPVIGIHLVDEIGKIKGNGLLIIGAFGKVVFISAEKISDSFSIIQTKDVSMYAVAFNLSSYIDKHILFRGGILYSSPKGDVWFSEFSKREEEKCSGKEDLKLLEKSIMIKQIASFKLLNESDGLFLLLTKTGNLYLSQYREQICDTSVSLPSVMNEAMHQSLSLQHLNSVKACQLKLFEALSVFASLKLISGSSKVKVNYEILKLDVLPKRLCFTISLKNLETQDLNPDFWYISISLFSCFQKDCSIVSRTVPFNTDIKDITMEVEESVLTSLHCPLFPLHLVIGLILILPENFKSMNCFKLIDKELPLYLPIQSFIVNELSLISCKSKSIPYEIFTHNPDCGNSQNLFQDVHALTMKRPIFRFFENCCMKINMLSTSFYPSCFTFCLLTSNLYEMKKCFTRASSIAENFFQNLLHRASLEENFVDESYYYKNQPIMFRISKQNDITNITIDTNSFALSTGLKMAIIHLFYKYECKLPDIESRFIMISSAISNKCERLSQDLLSMYGQDVEARDIQEKIWLKYFELRKLTTTLRHC